jgi:hypothetical protein
MRAVISSSDQDQIDSFAKRFECFKQRFDRGISIQSAVTLEASAVTLEAAMTALCEASQSATVSGSRLISCCQRRIMTTPLWLS